MTILNNNSFPKKFENTSLKIIDWIKIPPIPFKIKIPGTISSPLQNPLYLLNFIISKPVI
jgi:hypothetical protein